MQPLTLTVPVHPIPPRRRRKPILPPPAPDDPRHGTYAGAVAHWSAKEKLSKVCPPCCQAATRQRKRNLWRSERQGVAGLQPVIGYRRRLRALQALGWSVKSMAASSGPDGLTAGQLFTVLNPRRDLRNERSGAHVTIHTAVKVLALYKQLSMKVPDGDYTKRVRMLASKQRWAPPLAWETLNIDDPGVEPWGWDIDIELVTARRKLHRSAHNTRLDRRRVLEDCVAEGKGISDAVRLIGASRDAIQKWCGARDLHHLYRALVAREDGMRGGTVDHNNPTSRDRAA